MSARSTFFEASTRELMARLPLGPDAACVLLHGPLGAGKTTFVQELLALLAKRPVGAQSPTFLKVLEYEIGPDTRALHLDCYRMDEPDELLRLGLESYRPAKLWLVEWPEHFTRALAENPGLRAMWGLGARALRVEIEMEPGGVRSVRIQDERLG